MIIIELLYKPCLLVVTELLLISTVNPAFSFGETEQAPVSKTLS